MNFLFRPGRRADNAHRPSSPNADDNVPPCHREVLLISDPASSLSCLPVILSGAGYVVREAPVGDPALRTLKAHPPELVLLDIGTPAMDDFDIYRRIKAEAGIRDIPVILFSARDEAPHKVQGLRVGTVDFIGRNFTEDEMLARIDTHIAFGRVKKALEKERAALENRVRERTEELRQDIARRLAAEEENRALERALWQARKLEAIGLLAGGIAHDFNHLLSLILGYAQFAQNALASGKTEKLAGYLAEILKAGDEGRAVVGQLLAFSRADELASEAVDIGGVIAEAVDSLRPAMGAGIGLDFAATGPLPPLFIKPVQARQVATNLILNARDAIAARPDGGSIAVRLSMERPHPAQTCVSCRKPFAGEHLLLTVEDDGHGIAPEILDRLFDPFFTTKDIGKGVGLGLPMVHGITHSAGGHMTLDSPPGGGSRFRIWLPAASGREDGGGDPCPGSLATTARRLPRPARAPRRN